MIDKALFLLLMVILAALAAHLLSLTVGAVLTAAMTPITDALDHVLRTHVLQGAGG